MHYRPNSGSTVWQSTKKFALCTTDLSTLERINISGEIQTGTQSHEATTLVVFNLFVTGEPAVM